MNRALTWAIGSGLVVAAIGLVVVMAQPGKGPVFIAGDRPVTEDQVRQKLQSEGWSNIQIVRDGRYFEAIASKDEQSSKTVVDSQTGRLRAAADDDDDD
jgi:UDP-N-acetyl-D-mannosaminuronic acid transferase (WecB/TagA/CpsF family)